MSGAIIGVRGTTIQTRGGTYFDFLEPLHRCITIDDIAHALSHICRFTGHTRFFYSVAQHSLMVSRLVPPELALQGLLHDAHEAYIGDVSSPLKQLLPDYKRLERSIEASVRAAFGLPAVLHPAVKHADLVALRTEQRDLMRSADLWTELDGIEPLQEQLEWVPPSLARDLFLRRYREITR